MVLNSDVGYHENDICKTASEVCFRSMCPNSRKENYLQIYIYIYKSTQMILILIRSTLPVLDTCLSQYLRKQPVWSNISIHLPVAGVDVSVNGYICLYAVRCCASTAQWAFLTLHGHRQVNKIYFVFLIGYTYINLPKNALRPTVKYRTSISNQNM